MRYMQVRSAFPWLSDTLTLMNLNFSSDFIGSVKDFLLLTVGSNSKVPKLKPFSSCKSFKPVSVKTFGASEMSLVGVILFAMCSTVTPSRTASHPISMVNSPFFPWKQKHWPGLIEPSMTFSGGFRRWQAPSRRVSTLHSSSRRVLWMEAIRPPALRNARSNRVSSASVTPLWLLDFFMLSFKLCISLEIFSISIWDHSLNSYCLG